MKITTRRLEPGKYLVLKDGKPTNVMIEKGDKPNWGCRQEWWVCPADDNGSVYFKTHGKDQAVGIVRCLIDDLGLGPSS